MQSHLPLHKECFKSFSGARRQALVFILFVYSIVVAQSITKLRRIWKAWPLPKDIILYHSIYPLPFIRPFVSKLLVADSSCVRLYARSLPFSSSQLWPSAPQPRRLRKGFLAPSIFALRTISRVNVHGTVSIYSTLCNVFTHRFSSAWQGHEMHPALIQRRGQIDRSRPRNVLPSLR